MLGEHRSHYSRRLSKKLSERGKRMAQVRWQQERKRQNQLAALTAEQFPHRISLRVIVIRNELHVSEATIWNWESARAARRKIRLLGL